MKWDSEMADKAARILPLRHGARKKYLRDLLESAMAEITRLEDIIEELQRGHLQTPDDEISPDDKIGD